MTALYCPGCHREFAAVAGTDNPKAGDIVVCTACAEPSMFLLFRMHSLPMNNPARYRPEVIEAQAEAFHNGLDRALAKLQHPSGR